jgi:plasmid stabilization system protein ParE
MVVRWSDIAAERLKQIFDYYLDVAGYDVAIKTVTKIKQSADS